MFILILWAPLIWGLLVHNSFWFAVILCLVFSAVSIIVMSANLQFMNYGLDKILCFRPSVFTEVWLSRQLHVLWINHVIPCEVSRCRLSGILHVINDLCDPVPRGWSADYNIENNQVIVKLCLRSIRGMMITRIYIILFWVEAGGFNSEQIIPV